MIVDDKSPGFKKRKSSMKRKNKKKFKEEMKEEVKSPMVHID